jgi:hypothetical protein
MFDPLHEATRNGSHGNGYHHAETLAAEACLIQDVEVVNDESARQRAVPSRMLARRSRGTRGSLTATGRTAVAVEAFMNNVR